MGKLLVSAGQRDKAMERAAVILREDPGNEDAQILQGAVLLAGKEYGKARAHLEGMLSRGVTKPDVYMLLAATYTRDKEYRSAEGVLVRGLKTHEKFLPLHRGLADVYLATGRTEETAGEVRKVIELEPENYGNRITLAGLYWDTGQQAKGREVLDALLSEKPADEGRRLDTAAFYGSRGSVPDAEAVLREGIRQNGKSYRMRFLLSDLYRETGQDRQRGRRAEGVPGPRQGPGGPGHPPGESRPGPGVRGAAGARQGERVRRRGDQGEPEGRGRPPVEREPVPAAAGRARGRGGVPHGGQRQAAVRRGLPVPGRGAPAEQGDGAGAGYAAARAQGRPGVAGHAQGAGESPRDEERIPQSGGVPEEKPRGAAGEPAGDGGSRGPVPGGEGLEAGGRRLPRHPAGGAAERAGVHADGGILRSTEDLGPRCRRVRTGGEARPGAGRPVRLPGAALRPAEEVRPRDRGLRGPGPAEPEGRFPVLPDGAGCASGRGIAGRRRRRSGSRWRPTRTTW